MITWRWEDPLKNCWLTKRRTKFVLLFASLFVSGHIVHAAGNISGQMNAQISFLAGCVVSGAPGTGNTAVNFGTLDFGTHPSTFTGTLLATPNNGAGGAGATMILCSPDVAALSVSISAGNNAGQGG